MIKYFSLIFQKLNIDLVLCQHNIFIYISMNSDNTDSTETKSNFSILLIQIRG